VTIDRFGIWTLKRLGYRDQVFDVHAGLASQSLEVRYRLPPGARQGPTYWYLIRLHFTIRIASDSGEGRVYVDSGTNGWASAQIRFDVMRKEDGSLLVRSDALGLVKGSEVKTGPELTREITFRNYIPYGGVRSGVNPWSFVLKQRDRARVEALRIFSDSAIEYTRLAPAKIDVLATPSATLIRAGQEFQVRVVVKNTGGQAASQGKVSVRFPHDKLRLVGSPTRRLPTLAGGESTTARFRFRSLRRGSVLIEVGASSGLSHDEAIVGIRVRPRG
jgi:CARDB